MNHSCLPLTMQQYVYQADNHFLHHNPCGGTWSVTMFEFDAVVEYSSWLPKAAVRTGMLLWMHTVQYSIQ